MSSVATPMVTPRSEMREMSDRRAARRRERR
jgi:hypothetical protein